MKMWNPHLKKRREKRAIEGTKMQSFSFLLQSLQSLWFFFFKLAL